MRWISASNACQTKSTRTFVVDEVGRSLKDARYAAARIATVESSEKMVVWSIREARSVDALVPGISTIWWLCEVERSAVVYAPLQRLPSRREQSERVASAMFICKIWPLTINVD